MTGVAWGLLGGFFLVAAGDWSAVATGRDRVRPLTKCGCMVLLIGAAIAMRPDDGGARVALVVALVLSLAGDAFLLRDDARSFTFGLGSFLLAHVAYVTAFALAGLRAEMGSAAIVVLLAGAVSLVGRKVMEAVRANEPELARPVGAYITVIMVMTGVAAYRWNPLAIAGAALFAGSDSLIAFRRFVAERPWQPLAIIVSYHVAQALLTLSFAA